MPLKISSCKHIRIRDSNEYGFNVEKCITSLEDQYDIDLRRLPQWKELIQRLHVSTTDCKRKIQDAKLRKKMIIDKLYTQNTRPSPFELTDMLTRTAKTWQRLEARNKKSKISSEPVPERVIPNEKVDEITGEISETQFTAHPNTEIMVSQDDIVPPIKDIETEINVDEIPHLPAVIITNQHKFISPLGTDDNGWSYQSQMDDFEIRSESIFREWLSLKETSLVKCFPKEITITKNTLKKQSISFSIMNCTTKYLNIRFKCVTDISHLKNIKILPVTPRRLYPGIAVCFKFIFKLQQKNESFTSSLYFRIGHKVLAESPTEAFLIPIVSKLMVVRSVTVSETVKIPAAYSWHINKTCGYPSGIVKISVNDDSHYHLHVVKRLGHLIPDSVSLISVAVMGPSTESLIQRTETSDSPDQNKEFSSPIAHSTSLVVVESLKTIDYIALIIDEIVALSLETFVFEQTCLDLTPHKKKNIPVYFTKPEHIGYHQCYYNFELYDPETENIISTKTVLLLAEVLPHPVRIFPEILDMSNSPITHGFCEDHITLTNTHKFYQVEARIKLTTKMKQIFNITPMESNIPAESKVDFVVRLCSRDFNSVNKEKDLSHFTFKIIFSGPKAVYYNVPPMFYEMIVPCAMEFKKVYNEKFYRDVSDRSLQEK